MISAVQNPSLSRALAERGYDTLTPVQSAVLGPEVGENDLLVSAQTGSGKTVAYGLTFATTLLGAEEKFGPANEPLALVIAPTRELALQVQTELSWLYAQTGARIVVCVGGMDPRREQRQLEMGAHIVVGTPGRLLDHLERGNLDSSKLRVLVLDEADEMLDLGFREDLEAILDSAPPERRTLLFSATLPRDIVRLAKRYQRDAVRIDTIIQNQPHGDIEYRVFRVAPNEIELAVVNVLRLFDTSATIVFCKTRDAVRHLHASLVERGFAAVALSGEMGQSDRVQALQALRDGRAKICVATDVAARGLDLPDLGLVLHFDLPTGAASLLHRSGRTGRAGRKGISALLVPYTSRSKAERLLNTAGVDATWVGPPSGDEIRARDDQRLIDEIANAEALAEDEVALVRALIARASVEQLASSLIRMRRAALPAPEELFDPGPQRDRRPDTKREPRGRDKREDRRPDRPEREPRGEFHGGGPRSDFLRADPAETAERDSHSSKDMVWFKMSIGHDKDADPKWLLPLICRRGHVTRAEVGAIRIFDRETRFEIAVDSAEKFNVGLRRSGEEEIRIEQADGAPTSDLKKSGPRAGAFKGKPRRAGFKPGAGKKRDFASKG